MPMNRLADEVAVHQSTLTRVVDKLEQKGFVSRARRADNQRVVNVCLTESGSSLFKEIDAASNQMIAQIIARVDPSERAGVVRGLEVLCDLLDPHSARAQQVLAGCCRCEPADDASAEVGP